MDALEKALSMAESAIEADTLDGWNTRMFSAQAYAAIAQAEQLKRIADMMEADRKAAKTESDARAFAAQVRSGR